MKRHNIYRNCIKRILDFLLALLLSVLLLPLIGIIAIVVRIKLGAPVIYKQPRPGKNGKVFNLYKFRSMTDERDENGELLPDELRITSFGKKLRSTSIDELPELINIIKGDMALVGPRPLLVQYLPLYNKTQARRHEVRPGITGYAQVNGRNSISWEDKFEKDVYYVDHVSFWEDVKIIIQTVRVVIVRDGITSQTSVTMEPFKGTPEEIK